MPQFAPPLLISGGTLVLPGVGTVRADVAVHDGRIAALGPDLDWGHASTIDATGLHIFPGLVDPHVHFGIQTAWAAECALESRAALLGGVTTLGCYLRSRESYLPTLETIEEEVARACATDLFVHLQVFTEQQLAELPSYRKAGVASFKLYLAGIPGVVPHSDEGFILDAFEGIARLGPDCVASVHAESAPLVERGVRRAASAGAAVGPPLRVWSEARPPAAETLAARTAAFLAEQAGVPLYVVHVTAAETVAALAMERERPDRPPIYLEATSAHLGLDWDEPNGLLAKLVPPARSPANREALWRALASGAIGTVGTDNTARDRASKRPEAGPLQASPGYHGLSTHLPVLLEEGFHRRGVPLEVLAERACAAPARVFGLSPRKGTLAVGSDADLVLVDLAAARTVTPPVGRSVADFSPFEGRTLRGWPAMTIRAGRIVAKDGRLVDDLPPGRVLAR